MATPRQIRGVFAPVLAAHPDLVLHRRWLFRPPIVTALCGLHIGRTSSARVADIVFSVVPLSRFLPPAAVGFEIPFIVQDHSLDTSLASGNGIAGTAASRLRDDILAPDYPVHLLATFNGTAKPLLDALTTFENIADWLSRFRQQPLRLTAAERVDAWLATMRGDFAAGANHLEALLQRRAASGLVGTDQATLLEREVQSLLQSADRAAIAAFLHDLERRTIGAHGLERYWQKAPFPFERG